MSADIAATTIALLIIAATASAQTAAPWLEAPSVMVRTEAEIEAERRTDAANGRMLLKNFHREPKEQRPSTTAGASTWSAAYGGRARGEAFESPRARGTG